MPTDTPAPAATPRDLLARYHRAMLTGSADDLADLYAEDAVHTFPFSTPGFPPSYRGREEVRAGYRAVWGTTPVVPRELRDVTVHDTADPHTVVAEHTLVAEIPATGTTFTVPGLLVLTAHDGHITALRDYMDGLGVARALNPAA
jgi:ketosteroid isomerase-like protein